MQIHVLGFQFASWFPVHWSPNISSIRTTSSAWYFINIVYISHCILLILYTYVFRPILYLFTKKKGVYFICITKARLLLPELPALSAGMMNPKGKIIFWNVIFIFIFTFGIIISKVKKTFQKKWRKQPRSDLSLGQ